MNRYTSLLRSPGPWGTRGAGTILAGRRFSPLAIPGLVAWYDAGVPNSLFQDSAMTTLAVADADPVGAFRDLSGRGFHLVQATADSKPTKRTNVLNGLPVVRFDGGDNLRVTFGQTFGQPRTMIAVSKRTGALSATQAVYDGIDSSNRNFLGYAVTTGNWNLYTGGAGGLNGGAVDGGFHISVFEANGATSTFRVDGGANVLSGNPGAHNVTGITLGADRTLGIPLTGDIFTFLMVNGTLAAATFSTLMRWLSQRIALAVSP